MRSNLLLPSRGSLDDFKLIAVTGGGGFVGQHLVRALIDLGKQVRVIDLGEPLHRLPPGVDYVSADLRTPSATTAALDGVDLVFHLAGNSSGTLSIAKPRFDFETNALGTFNVSEGCVQRGVRRLVYLSSACVYGLPQATPITEDHPTNPFMPYGSSKLAGEHIVRSLAVATGLSVVVARAFVIYGPGEHPKRAGGEVSQFLRWHLNNLPIPAVGDIDAKTRDFVHVTDVAVALILLADRAPSGEIFNIGTGEEVSLRELSEIIATVAGGTPVIDGDTSILEDSYRLVADIDKLCYLGFVPQVPLIDGVRALASHLGQFPQLPALTAAFRRGQLIGAGE